MLESTWLDVRHAVRTLRASPLFTTIAVVSLAVGIAGTTVIFGLADAYLLRPRPGITNPSRLVQIGRSGSEPFSGTVVFSTFSYPNYRDYSERQTVFSGLAATRAGVPFGLSVDGNASSVSGAYVSSNFFSVLGVRIALGRGFLPEEQSPGSPAAVAVISDPLCECGSAAIETRSGARSG